MAFRAGSNISSVDVAFRSNAVSVDVEFVESVDVEFVESVEFDSEVMVSPVGIVSSCSWVGDEVPLTDETC